MNVALLELGDGRKESAALMNELVNKLDRPLDAPPLADELLRIVIDELYLGLSVVDMDGVVRWWNAKAIDLIGPIQQDDPERWGDTYDAVSPVDGHRLTARELPMYRAMNGETVADERLLVTNSDGVTRLLMIQAFPIMNGPRGQIAAGSIFREIKARAGE